MEVRPRIVLGISAYYHDSAAALVVDGVPFAAAHEERFTRVKHDDAFPTHALEYMLREYGIGLADVDAIAFYDKPILKFERLLETYHSFAPRGVRSFLASMPVWTKEKLFMRSALHKQLSTFLTEGEKLPELLFPEHHLSHAASAFYPSPWSDAAILTVDGVGEWATTTIGVGNGSSIELLREMRFPHSLGLLYSAFTYYCGFKVNSGEYKLMGLAPYGRPGSARVAEYKRKILETLVDLKEDGSLFLNMEYFTYATDLRMIDGAKFGALFGLAVRSPESELTEEYTDMALAIQEVTDEAMLRLARTARALTHKKYLVMAGGVALNCVSNARIVAEGIFDDVWIQPAAGDAGGALGAALLGYYVGLGMPRRPTSGDAMQGSFLGPAYAHEDTVRMMRREGAVGSVFDMERLYTYVAERLEQGAVVGWMQGRMEWGPRSLGNRSILGDPRNEDMQKRMNLKIKYRESFRPFAPAVRREDVAEYFGADRDLPYMLVTAPVRADRRKPIPETARTLFERLYTSRSDIPAVTHLDYSARIETVSREANERFWNLLGAFKERTGCGVLINTSFNVRGEPIVMTPDDAYRCFMDTDMDVLVIGDTLFEKDVQPERVRRDGAPARAYALD